MKLTLRTLGTLEASTTDDSGAVRQLGRGKPVALLAYLACIPGHKASREHLATLLWSDVESDAARQNLRQTLWYLKKKLGDGLIEGHGDMLALVAPSNTDRDDFLQAAQRADFPSAIHRYRGAFIPDFAAPGASEFEQWCDLERRRLCVTFLRSADAVARQWLREGKFRDAQELARRARDIDPMDQATWRLLLEAHLAGSDGVGAASEAEHFESFMAREEQEPEAASLAAIRSARRAPSTTGPTDSGSAPSLAAELVGREMEFSRILGAWDAARAGTPRLLVISAAAGLGKSRLLRDVQARLRASRARVLLVRANPGDRLLTGGFLAEVVSQLAALGGAAAVSPGTAGVLVSLAPALASTYPSATADQSAGEEAARRRALAVVDLVRAVSDEHPVALLLDDLHWADDHSARVLTASLARAEHARLLVVMAKRPVPDPHAMFSTFERLELPPLDLGAVTAFVAQVAELPSAGWAELLPGQLLTATGGSPLLLVETLHHLMERSWLVIGQDDAWNCTDERRLAAALRDGGAVQQRIARLAPGARRVLLALAVAGRPLTPDELEAVVGGETRLVGEDLGALEVAGFALRNGSHAVVAHDEIAVAVLETADDAERRAMHAALARRLLAVAPDDQALRRAAEHGTMAGDDEAVVAAWRRFVDARRRAGDRRHTRMLAADLLGMDLFAPRVDMLLRHTPFLRRRRARWIVAAAALLTAAIGAATTMARRPIALPTSDFAVWVPDSVTGAELLVGVRIRADEPWEGGVPLVATVLDSMRFPRRTPGMKGAMYRSPNGREWIGGATFADMGDEGLFIDTTGQHHRILPSPHDDGVTGFSPDGRFVTGNTSRFDTLTDHMQVVTVDPRNGTLRRITTSSESDREGYWSPDGTRLAFTRRYYTTRRREAICLADADGAHERCLAPPYLFTSGLRGWIDDRRLLLHTIGDTLVTFDVTTGRTEKWGHLLGIVWSFDGRLRMCLCRASGHDASALYVIPANDPLAARPVLYRGRPLRGTPAYLGSAPNDRQWLDTLRLILPSTALSVDNVHQVSVEGRLANGAPAWLHDLRWSVRDTGVATVDSTGRVRPRRTGETWLVVSAGGWRSDSARIRIVPPSSRTVLRESWGDDWTARWRPFGTPMGTVVRTDRGPAFLPNGDGSYSSGAYTVTGIAAGEGVGLEADVSMPVTRTQWQTLALEFLSADALDQFARWDHRTGDGMSRTRVLCGAGFPGDEGGTALDQGVSNGKERRYFVPPPGLYDGSWHRIRFQLFPDGRCVLAIDGKAMAAVQATERASSGVILQITGHDRFGGRLVVGPLEVWTGVRGGVDWTTGDRR